MNNMNRRQFLTSTALGLGAVTLAPTIALASNEVPLYKQFDWFSRPASLIFRIESYQGKHSLVSTPIIARTQRLMIASRPDIDLTQQTVVGRQSGEFDHPQTYYTNEFLLNEAKRMGFTHIYSFVSYIEPDRCWYVVRGVKKPDWKTVDGKLQVVEVDKDGIPIKI